jgi:hypothetical protein
MFTSSALTENVASAVKPTNQKTFLGPDLLSLIAIPQ